MHLVDGAPENIQTSETPVLAKTSLARAKSPAFAHASKRPLYTTTSATTPACSMPRISKDSLKRSSHRVKHTDTEDKVLLSSKSCALFPAHVAFEETTSFMLELE